MGGVAGWLGCGWCGWCGWLAGVAGWYHFSPEFYCRTHTNIITVKKQPIIVPTKKRKKATKKPTNTKKQKETGQTLNVGNSCLIREIHFKKGGGAGAVCWGGDSARLLPL